MAGAREAIVERIAAVVPIDEVKEAVLNEYRRRIIRCKMVDEAMKRKYGVTFQEFESRNFVEKHDFSWQVESDAMEWEHAVEGVRYAEQKLKDIQRQ